MRKMIEQKKIKLAVICCGFAASALACILTVQTRGDLLPTADSLRTVMHDVRKVQVLDRRGVPLNITFQNRWNVHDYVPLYEIPEFIKTSFIVSEDKRFYHHKGYQHGLSIICQRRLTSSKTSCRSPVS